jgi:hypothetical protein
MMLPIYPSTLVFFAMMSNGAQSSAHPPNGKHALVPSKHFSQE